MLLLLAEPAKLHPPLRAGKVRSCFYTARSALKQNFKKLCFSHVSQSGTEPQITGGPPQSDRGAEAFQNMTARFLLTSGAFVHLE